ncbi:MAG TPA: hypothetical protein VFV50_14545 [Bdellovibrionales bacterium]|nr:hypothetical protein [Bdellovibrionales bacterium]
MNKTNKTILLLVAVLFAVTASFNACSELLFSQRQSGDGGSTTGDPMVSLEVSFAPFDAHGISSLTSCLGDVTFEGAGVTHTITRPPADTAISHLGTSLGTVEVPRGAYTHVRFHLTPACLSGRSLRVVNANGDFSASAQSTIVFSGSFSASADSLLRLFWGTIPAALGQVQSDAGLVPALESSEGRLEYPAASSIFAVTNPAAQAAESVACPAGSTVTGCSADCSGRAGGARFVTGVCHATCETPGPAPLTAYCARDDFNTGITVRSLTNVPRDTIATCPMGTEVIGCAGTCFSGHAGGVSRSGTNGCKIFCDVDEPGANVTAFCKQGTTAEHFDVTAADAPSGTQVNCPSGSALTGAAAVCNIGKAGGVQLLGPNSVRGVCVNGETVTVTAFCSRVASP